MVHFKNEGDPAEVQKFKDGIMGNYNKQGSAYYSTERLWDDGIIKAHNIRRVLGLSLSASLNAPVQRTDAGVFRM